MPTFPARRSSWPAGTTGDRRSSPCGGKQETCCCSGWGEQPRGPGFWALPRRGPRDRALHAQPIASCGRLGMDVRPVSCCSRTRRTARDRRAVAAGAGRHVARRLPGFHHCWLAYWLFAAGATAMVASTAATISLLDAATAVLLAVVFLGERLSGTQWPGPVRGPAVRRDGVARGEETTVKCSRPTGSHSGGVSGPAGASQRRGSGMSARPCWSPSCVAWWWCWWPGWCSSCSISSSSAEVSPAGRSTVDRGPV